MDRKSMLNKGIKQLMKLAGTPPLCVQICDVMTQR